MTTIISVTSSTVEDMSQTGQIDVDEFKELLSSREDDFFLSDFDQGIPLDKNSSSPRMFIPFPADVDISSYDYVVLKENLSKFDFQSWANDEFYLPITVIHAVTFVLGLIGNLFVIFVLLSGKKTRTSVTSTILASLAVSDVLFLSVCVPYQVMTKQKLRWPGDETMCKMAAFVEILSASATVLNLTAVSIERYTVIVHPMKSRSWCTTGRTQKFVLIVWAAALLISSPVLYVMELEVGLYYDAQSHVVVRTCGDRNATSIGGIIFAWYLLLAIFVHPLCIMIYCYSLVISELWFSTKQLDLLIQRDSCTQRNNRRSRQDFNGSTRGGSTRGGSTRSGGGAQNVTLRGGTDLRPVRKQVIKMLLTIIGLFFVFWGPKWIINVIRKQNGALLSSQKALVIVVGADMLPFIHSCFNPFVYSFMSTNFRRSVRDTFIRIASVSGANLPTGSRTGVELACAHNATGPAGKDPGILYEAACSDDEKM